jgi:hypothetical protein
MPSLHFLFHTLQLFNSGSFLPHKIFSSSLYLTLPLLTLPQSGSNSMFDQILEIGYPDYVVDVDNLHLRTNSAITLMKLDGQKPYEVPNTPNHQCGSTVVTVE